MRLVRAELRRFAKRRLIRWLLLSFVLLLGLVLASASYQSHPVTAADRVAAQAEAERALHSAQAEHQQRVAPCLAAVKRGQPPPAGFSAECDAELAPDPGMYRAEGYLPYELDFVAEVGGYLQLFTALLALVALILGATFVGAEWSSGALANLLLWRPQRGRVLIAKVAVAVGAVLVLGSAFAAAWTAGVYLVARFDGSVAGATPGVLRSVALDGARAVGLALFAAAFGCCVASIGRHTATAFGAALGIGLISEVGVPFAARLLDLRFPESYLLSTYAQAWVRKGLTLEATECLGGAGCPLGQRDIFWYDSLAVFGAGTVLLMLMAFVLIRRRAVT